MIRDIINKMSLKEKVGQLCVPIFEKGEIDNDLLYYINDCHISTLRFCPNAVFDNASEIVGEPNKYRSPKEMAEFLNCIQKLSIDATGMPLFISVDQEGSTRNDVNRGGAFAYSGHMSFGSANDPKLTYDIAKATAKEFRSMGINHVQAPICDVLTYEGRSTMKAACFGSNPEKVSEHALMMMKGLQDGGVASMGKHFPGYGSIATDAHKGVAEIFKSKEQLEKEDLLPFFALIKNGVNGLMMGHVIAHCFDNDLPATLSPAIINEYIRKELRFDGILMTDAMRMHAIQDRYGTGVASVKAIQAGCDLVLLRGSREHFNDGYFAILNAVKEGAITEERINESLMRILTQKERVGILANPYVNPELANEIVGCKEHKELSKRLAQSSVTTFKNKDLPIRSDSKILAISVTPQKIKAANDLEQCIEMLPRSLKEKFSNVKEYMLSLNPSEEEIKKCVEEAKYYDVIVLGLCNAIIYTNQVNLGEQISKLNKIVIAVAMDSPYDVELFPYFNNFITTYGVSRDSMRMVSDVILGTKNGDAICPVPITIK